MHFQNLLGVGVYFGPLDNKLLLKICDCAAMMYGIFFFTIKYSGLNTRLSQVLNCLTQLLYLLLGV